MCIRDRDKEITTRVSYVSKSINPVNRTFAIECDLKGGDYRANQIAVMKIVDYQKANAFLSLIHISPIMLSGNTDCYQPVEAKLKITRQLLEVLERFHHPVGVITKSALILRDKDILSRMAEKNLVSVAISINTLDESLRRQLEPRTASIPRRLQVIEELSAAGIHVHAMLAPVIPGLNDHEIMDLMGAVSKACLLYTSIASGGLMQA